MGARRRAYRWLAPAGLAGCLAVLSDGPLSAALTTVAAFGAVVGIGLLVLGGPR